MAGHGPKKAPACADGTRKAAIKAIDSAYNTILNGPAGFTLAQKAAAI